MKLRGFVAGGALAFALVLTGCGGGGGNAGGNAGGGNAGANTITIGTPTGAELEFAPKTATAPANTQITLTFRNESTTLPHGLAFQDGITAATDPNVPPGQSETLSFTTPGPGSYKFVCTIHPGMEGTLTVQ